MYIVIYSFKTKPDQQEIFIQKWGELTDLIYRHENSLGSRLHQVNTSEFIAYAQWPSKAIFDKAGSNLPEQSSAIRQAMKDSCDSINTMHKMDMVSDKLMPFTFDKNVE